MDETTPDRPTLVEEAERLLGYWERHGNNPETVSSGDIAEAIERAYARGKRDGWADAKCNEWAEDAS